MGVGKPLFDSGRKRPVPSTIFTPSPPASVCSFIKATTLRNVSDSTTVSGFSNSIYSPFACLIAWLLAFEKPTLPVFAIQRTSGNFSFSIFTEPSTEALSTTNISVSMPWLAVITECRHCSRKYLTL